jgi:hypothetical protein
VVVFPAEVVVLSGSIAPVHSRFWHGEQKQLP